MQYKNLAKYYVSGHLLAPNVLFYSVSLSERKWKIASFLTNFISYSYVTAIEK